MATVDTSLEPVTPCTRIDAGLHRHAERASDAGEEGGLAGAGIEHQAERAFAVDQHRRPDAPDAVAQGRRDVARLGRFDLNFFDGRFDGAERRSGSGNDSFTGRQLRCLR